MDAAATGGVVLISPVVPAKGGTQWLLLKTLDSLPAFAGTKGRGNDESGSHRHQFSFSPCTRTRPSGIVRSPVSLVVYAHSQWRWKR